MGGFFNYSSLKDFQFWFWTVSLYNTILAFISNLYIGKRDNPLENINCLHYQILQGKSGENVVNYLHIIIFMRLESHRSQVLKGHSTWICKGFLFSSLPFFIYKIQWFPITSFMLHHVFFFKHLIILQLLWSIFFNLIYDSSCRSILQILRKPIKLLSSESFVCVQNSN